MADAPPPPPFRPPSPTPLSTKATSYRSARQNELDAVRSKGVAKIFYRHFTDATEKNAAEREAAEFALNDIIARKAELKANPKSFDKDGLTLTQLDALHMELQKRKQTVQRKERETIELHRRYVSQYGGSDALARKALAKHGSPSPAVNTKGNANLGSSITGLGSTMPVLHENRDYDIIRHTDLVTARANERKKCDGVGSMAAQKLEDGSFYDSTRAPPSPSRGVGKLNKESVVQSQHLLDTTGELNSSIGVESPGLMASSGSSTTPQDKTATKKDRLDFPPLSPSNSFGNISGLDGSFLGGVMIGNDDDMDDADSLMSGLTSVDGATIAIAEFTLTEFLREETDNIKKMLSGNIGQSDYSDDELSDIQTVRTTTTLESQKASHAAKNAEELAKKMAEATAWMDDPSLLDNDSDGENSVGTSPQSKPEWVAYYSDKYEKVYYYNKVTSQTCWTEPRDAVIDKSLLKNSVIPKKCDAGDTVVVKDYTKSDTVVVKDYTKSEPKSKQRNVSMAENLALIDQFRPDSDAISVASGHMSRTSRASKSLAYKRKRALKKRRRNRIIIGFFTMCSMFGVVVYRSREQWVPMLGMQTSRQKEATIAAESANLQKEEEERKLAAGKRAELAAKKKAELEANKKVELEAKKKAEEKRIGAELAAKKKAEEAELAAKKKAEEAELAAKKKAEEAELAAKKKAEEVELAAKKKAEEAELAAKKKAEEKRIKAELAAQKKAEEERIKTEKLQKVAKEKAEKAAKKKAEERKLVEMAAEEERKAAELAAKKAEEERIKAELAAKKKAELEAVRKAAEEERKLAVLEAAKKVAKLKAAEEERKLAELKAEKEREAKIREDERRKVEEEFRRKQELEQSASVEVFQEKKVNCRKPFARFFVKACKEKALATAKAKAEAKKKRKRKPLFDLKGLVDSMMQ